MDATDPFSCVSAYVDVLTSIHTKGSTQSRRARSNSNRAIVHVNQAKKRDSCRNIKYLPLCYDLRAELPSPAWSILLARFVQRRKTQGKVTKQSAVQMEAFNGQRRNRRGATYIGCVCLVWVHAVGCEKLVCKKKISRKHEQTVAPNATCHEECNCFSRILACANIHAVTCPTHSCILLFQRVVRQRES